MNELPRWQYAAYLVLYLVVMADDLVISYATMTSLQIARLSGRYTRASNLIGGALLLRPDLLMFARALA